MLIDVRVPEAGESITQVELAKWLVTDGQYVQKDQEIAEIDSDKATLTISASDSGAISIKMEEGSETKPGELIGTIDTNAEKPEATHEDKPAADSTEAGEVQKTHDQTDDPENDSPKIQDQQPEASDQASIAEMDVKVSPQARKLMDELDLEMPSHAIHPDSKRITKKDVLAAIAASYKATDSKADHDKNAIVQSPVSVSWGGNRNESRQKMSTLRRKIAERLVAVKNQTAMLTTFNEVDMSAIMALRTKYQDAFTKKFGLKLGFMSLFTKAITVSIPYFPQINGYIEDDHIVIPDYADIGIAVSTPKGLMVPVIRNAESLSIAKLEEKIQDMAKKAREGKISMEDLKGGTFSITNGGIFGSMLSTPIINPPQSAILGMHSIIERPVAIDGQVVIRPMMYIALSYDHRIIDGKESVSFLVKVKEMIENPTRLLLQGKDPENILLGL